MVVILDLVSVGACISYMRYQARPDLQSITYTLYMPNNWGKHGKTITGAYKEADRL